MRFVSCGALLVTVYNVRRFIPFSAFGMDGQGMDDSS